MPPAPPARAPRGWPSPRLLAIILAVLAVLAVAGVTVVRLNGPAQGSAQGSDQGSVAGTTQASGGPVAGAGQANRGKAAGAGPANGGAVALPFKATDVQVSGVEWYSWALMDRRTGQIWGSSTMDETSWTASMIKAWLAADYLQRAGPTLTAEQHHMIEIMIRDSDNNAANQVYTADGGAASINRLIARCGLTDSSPNSAGWAVTNLSARDSVRMGDCIGSGRAAGPQWTDWLLSLMRGVRGEGNFGIRTALPAAEAATVAIKNGYEDFAGDGLYHVNCLAVGDTWTLAVMQRYQPQSSWDPDLALGAGRCAAITAQLRAAAQ